MDRLPPGLRTHLFEPRNVPDHGNPLQPGALRRISRSVVSLRRCMDHVYAQNGCTHSAIASSMAAPQYPATLHHSLCTRLGVRRLDGRHTSRHDESRRMAGRTRRRTSSRADRIPYRRTSLAEIQTTTVPYGNLRCCRAGADEPPRSRNLPCQTPLGRRTVADVEDRLARLAAPSPLGRRTRKFRGGVRTGTGRLFRRRGAAPAGATRGRMSRIRF